MSTSLPILLVACNQRNIELLSQFLSKTGYATRSVRDVHAFALLIESSFACGLALIDITGFDQGIWIHCEELSRQGVPLVVVAPQAHQHLQYKSYSHGAKGVLFKPLVMQELLGTVKQLFVEA